MSTTAQKFTAGDALKKEEMDVEAEVRTTLELRIRLTNLEANLLRLAMSLGSGEEQIRKAGSKSLQRAGVSVYDDGVTVMNKPVKYSMEGMVWSQATSTSCMLASH